MLKKFNHVAIVVPNLEEASNKYKDVLNANVSKIFNYDQHGVSVVFVDLGNTKIELMYPYGENSPIRNFLDKNINGAIHHICIEVKNIEETCKNLKKKMSEFLVMENQKLELTISQLYFFTQKISLEH